MEMGRKGEPQPWQIYSPAGNPILELSKARTHPYPYRYRTRIQFNFLRLLAFLNYSRPSVY
jgi:hypothetical protein